MLVPKAGGKIPQSCMGLPAQHFPAQAHPGPMEQTEVKQSLSWFQFLCPRTSLGVRAEEGRRQEQSRAQGRAGHQWGTLALPSCHRGLLQGTQGYQQLLSCCQGLRGRWGWEGEVDDLKTREEPLSPSLTLQNSLKAARSSGREENPPL